MTGADVTATDRTAAEPPGLTTVLHLSSSSGPGGAEAVVATLASRLNASRYRSIVCLLRDGWLRERCEGLGLETHVIRLQGFLDLGWLRRFVALLNARNVALIHAHEFDANIYAALAGRLARVPLIATVHGRSYYSGSRKRRLAYRLVSRAAVMVAVSDDVKRFLSDAAGVSAKRVHVVRNGITPASSVPDETKAALRAELGIRGGESVVTVVGSLYEVKGHRYLFEAIPTILRSCPSTVLLVAGRGPMDARLREQVQTLGIAERVRFLGLRADVAALLAISDVFVLPSLSEGLSIAVLEAMAARRPVVATRVGGNPELIMDGETGLLVPPADPHALAMAVTSLLLRPGEARRLGDNALEHVRTSFSLTGMVGAYEAMYESVLRCPRFAAPRQGGVAASCRGGRA